MIKNCLRYIMLVGVILGAIALILSYVLSQNEVKTFNLVFISPDINSHDAYVTDGVYHYGIDHARILKYDSNWNLVSSNDNPMQGLNVNEFAEAEYNNGIIYIGAKLKGSSCTTDTNFSYLLYNANTLGFIEQHQYYPNPEPISGLVTKRSNAIAIDVNDGLIYGMNYCDGRGMTIFSLNTFEIIGEILLDPQIPDNGPQGLEYYNDRIYVTSDADDAIYEVLPTGHTKRIFKTGQGGSTQGLEWFDGQLRVLIDTGSNEKVYYYEPVLFGGGNLSAQPQSNTIKQLLEELDQRISIIKQLLGLSE